MVVIVFSPAQTVLSSFENSIQLGACMKLIFPVTVLFIAALACGRFGANSTANSNNASNANLKPAPPVKAVDVPAMIGKSGDEIKKMIPTAPDFDQYDQKSWTLP